jgi:hypothetical protein
LIVHITLQVKEVLILHFIFFPAEEKVFLKAYSDLGLKFGRYLLGKGGL